MRMAVLKLLLKKSFDQRAVSEFQRRRRIQMSKSENLVKAQTQVSPEISPQICRRVFFQLKKKMTTQVMGGVNFARVSRPGAEKFPSSCHNGSTVHTATAILATVTF